jgi:hypothetical protein
MIHPNQVLSMFKEGLDTKEISELYLISEGEAYALLDQARRAKFSVKPRSPDSIRRGANRGVRAAAISNRKRPVSLAPISFLGGKS